MRPMVHSERVGVGPRALPGELDRPQDAAALVLFAHGPGDKQAAAHNRDVAEVLHLHQLATLRFDPWGGAGPAEPGRAVDHALLGESVVQALDWVARQRELAGLRIGLFGSDGGAAEALAAAGARPGQVVAVVVQGGRPDLAACCLPRVNAPTLLVVGESDHELLERNRAALRLLGCRKRLEVVPGATHRFDEPGAMDVVAALAVHWYATHLVNRS